MANERGTPHETEYEPPHPAVVDAETVSTGGQIAPATARGKSVAALAKGHINTETGEEAPLPVRTGEPGHMPLSLRDNTFLKVATKAVNKIQAATLMKPIDEKREADILPTGELYMSHVFMRRRLNKAFNPMGWALRPLTAIAVDPVTNVMYREYALVINGVVVGTSFGSTKYQVQNARQDYADAAEAVKSNALTRCCKDLGIGSECWDRQWCEAWKDKYAVHVWVGSTARDGKVWIDHYWRRKDAKPFKGEIAKVDGTPNDRAASIRSLPVCADFAEARQLYATRKRGRTAPPDSTQSPEPQEAPVRPVQGGGESTAARNPEKGATEVADLPPGQTVQGKVPDHLKKFVIQTCKIADTADQSIAVPGDPGRTMPKWTLYAIKTHDGTEYTTFSSTIYGLAQRALAERKLVAITFDAKKLKEGKHKNRAVRNIVKIEAYVPKDAKPQVREPGEEG